MKHRILVVDDSEIVTKVVSKALASAGYEVDYVNSSLQATAAMVAFKPHLVLLDLNMPGLKGEQIVDLAVKRKFGFFYRVVIHSSEEESRLREATCKEGVIGYIKKGNPGDNFLNAVKKYICMCDAECGADAANSEAAAQAAFVR